MAPGLSSDCLLFTVLRDTNTMTTKDRNDIFPWILKLHCLCVFPAWGREKNQDLEHLEYSISHKDLPKLILNLQWNIDTQTVLACLPVGFGRCFYINEGTIC